MLKRCKLCKDPIEYDDRRGVWVHTNTSPRHIPQPEEQPEPAFKEVTAEEWAIDNQYGKKYYWQYMIATDGYNAGITEGDRRAEQRHKPKQTFEEWDISTEHCHCKDCRIHREEVWKAANKNRGFDE